jgi:hypothetical protein
MKMPTLGQASAFGRHVVSYAMGAITMAAAVHVVNGQDASSLTTAVSNIANGVTSIAGGIATIVSVAAGLYAAWSSSPLSQASGRGQERRGQAGRCDHGGNGECGAER